MGKPKAAACLLSITLPQETTGFTLQPGVKVLPATLYSRILNLSSVITHAASSPAAPVMTSSRAKARLPPTVRPSAGRSGPDTAETSLTVVLLITPIPSLESWTIFGHRPLCRTLLCVHRSTDIRKAARWSRTVRFRPGLQGHDSTRERIRGECTGSCKRYGGMTAVGGPDPGVRRGEMFGILWQDESAPTGLTADPSTPRPGLPGAMRKGRRGCPRRPFRTRLSGC
ncbi:hypothetical protein GPN2_12807 [Streptomyces murinus]